MKVNRAGILVISGLAVPCTLTVAIAVNVGSRMRREVVSQKAGRVEAVPHGGENIGKAIVKDKPVLLAEAGKPAFAPGEPVIITLTLRNETEAEIYRIDTNSIRDNQLEIKNSAGEKMPLSERGKKVLESPVLRCIVSRMGPGQVVQYEINVLDAYDLSRSGAYTVIVKRTILVQDRKKFAEIESNQVKVLVQQ
jgi:hypothetical protein